MKFFYLFSLYFMFFNDMGNQNKITGGVSKSMLTLNEAIIDVKKG